MCKKMKAGQCMNSSVCVWMRTFSNRGYCIPKMTSYFLKVADSVVVEMYENDSKVNQYLANQKYDASMVSFLNATFSI